MFVVCSYIIYLFMLNIVVGYVICNELFNLNGEAVFIQSFFFFAVSVDLNLLLFV